MIRLENADISRSELISDIIVRSFAEQAAILGINKEVYPNFVAFETPQRVESRLKGGGRAILAYRGDDPVGTVSYQIDPGKSGKGYIRRLAVLPLFRGRGWGQALMDCAESRLGEHGVDLVEISIVAGFGRLREYYRRLGYTPRERKLFPSLPFEVMYMDKRLCTFKTGGILNE